MILLKIWRKKLEVMRSGSPESVSLGEIETLYAVLLATRLVPDSELRRMPLSELLSHLA